MDINAASTQPKRKRRVFMWVFLAIQALFLLWIIIDAASGGPSTAAQVASSCYHHAWWPLYSSQADCVRTASKLYGDAGNVGKGLGIAALVAAWVIVDFLLAVTWFVVRLSRRH